MTDSYAICDEHENIIEPGPAEVEKEEILKTHRREYYLSQREDYSARLAAALAAKMAQAELRPVCIPSKRKESISWVIENIKAAPVAYFKFVSLIALACFVFSIVFYLTLDTILVNPVFALYGAVGSILVWVLATVSPIWAGK